MLLYILAGIGALTVVLILLILLSMFFGWLGQPVNYLAQPDEIQRYLRSWGDAISDGGRILVARPGTDQSVTFVKRHSRRVGDRLVFRVRNADSTRRHFEDVASALAAANIEFEMERTPTGRPRAIVVVFPLGGDPLPLAAASHTTRVALGAMGGPSDGPVLMTCTASLRPDYVRGSVDFIPWTRGHRAGSWVGQIVSRILRP